VLLAGHEQWHTFVAQACCYIKALGKHVIVIECSTVAGTSGIARGAVWYSPMRKEAMAEIKLF